MKVQVKKVPLNILKKVYPLIPMDGLLFGPNSKVKEGEGVKDVGQLITLASLGLRMTQS